jgi:tetratricopeptide (TPR) repeat protein
MVADDERVVDIEGFLTELPEVGSYIINITLYYIDRYGDQQSLAEQLIVKMEETAKNYFDQGEALFKSGDYNTALERFKEAKEMYLDGNFDAMVIETNRYIKLIKASQYFDEAMLYLGTGDIQKAFELLALARDLYEELEEMRMVVLIEEIMQGKTPEGPEGTSGPRTVVVTPGGAELTWLNLFLVVVIAGLLVYIFMRRSR